MTSKLNINWLNKCRCGNRMHTVETVRGSHVRLFEDDAVKCNACGREGVIQTCDGIATVLWETDEERAEGVTMTKSTITRERLQEIAEDGFLKHGESKELARMALAAMDSEPVAEVLSNRPGNDTSTIDGALPVGTQLYLHAQPAPEYPEVLPCSVFLEPGLRFGKGVKTRLVLEAIQRMSEHYAELEAMTPDERAEYDAGIEAFKAMLPQPAPVVPEEKPIPNTLRMHAMDAVAAIAEVKGWNACRAAMLNGGKS
ncbi:hypothetical protein [Klebsiella pneumoniae]|uniref:hypothetical protein n=1 Tax=Klebsiella pneumoniae TaxID=573 RepID=UPI001D02E8EB|nr:hypothetical protein [Klebsiella pneumoniae]